MNDADKMPFEEGNTMVGGIRDLLDGIVITDEYRRVSDLLEGCRPVVFVTGNAGTGKSTLIQYIRATAAKELAVV
ncbi:MAG: ATP-binding protein, partial [Dehalococcoidia bacterium]|nr:ATP-binding protein [Dehalococcoidia bacterium]